MAGDDSTEKREEFHLGRSTPPPTTSYVSVSNKHDYNFDIKTVAEPSKEDKDEEKDKDNKDDIDISRPDANPGYNPDEIKRREDGEAPKVREKREGGRDRDGDGGDKEKPQKKIDGSDVLDGQWIPPKDSKLQMEDEEDDNCTVKCLYYTMQCCECSIS